MLQMRSDAQSGPSFEAGGGNGGGPFCVSEGFVNA